MLATLLARLCGLMGRTAPAALVLALTALGGCRSQGRARTEMIQAPTSRPAAQPPAQVHQPPVAQPTEEPPPPNEQPTAHEEPIRITIAAPDRTRWYRVEEYDVGAAPESFAASFDRSRNKIDVETHGVTQFTIDTSRIPIDWDRLVILGIDGRNSELRRRDFDLLRFHRDKYGQWVIEEP